MLLLLQRKNPSLSGSLMARSIIICSERGHLNFSVSVSQVSFRLFVLLLNLQSGVWFTREMVLKVICEMPFVVTYLYSCLSFVQETGPEKNRPRSHIIMHS